MKKDMRILYYQQNSKKFNFNIQAIQMDFASGMFIVQFVLNFVQV